MKPYSLKVEMYINTIFKTPCQTNLCLVKKLVKAVDGISLEVAPGRF